jgi:hypothetical protein
LLLPGIVVLLPFILRLVLVESRNLCGIVVAPSHELLSIGIKYELVVMELLAYRVIMSVCKSKILVVLYAICVT